MEFPGTQERFTCKTKLCILRNVKLEIMNLILKFNRNLKGTQNKLLLTAVDIVALGMKLYGHNLQQEKFIPTCAAASLQPTK